ncbi:methylated-DNA--[protein]-cysteine S-methyltransferase [Eikenella sp. S3360]|uniref:Methylated-DNA--[protein]-cysteine S-methyltransferase n=1 Tax=Eikenella glucosivorans TaxID=2766967 RepID=A0ABS0N8T1_9NEIS|nr:methylated-DNA--[protein]-cysteine S-methyltransferase [Eikenella glucosivorans]MBH5328682.1 methylated-DNA--[protein]-cysteine S-methyltransferase [Eikenella glucosivorans]
MQYRYEAPFGTLICRFEGAKLTEILLGDERIDFLPLLPENSALARGLDGYFSGSLHALPKVAEIPPGTPFQRQVWAQIAGIPPGQTLSYQQIAERIGSHPRPVGGACGKNPLPLLIPCHRVLSASGLGGFSMGGDSERGLAVKRWLLKHEGITW